GACASSAIIFNMKSNENQLKDRPKRHNKSLSPFISLSYLTNIPYNINYTTIELFSSHPILHK
ncbi:MAG TPA: hypothetical protein VEX17_03100, partial [Bacillales bacterium]|nr:hypothetical protein [Bacillales bacterium]